MKKIFKILLALLLFIGCKDDTKESDDNLSYKNSNSIKSAIANDLKLDFNYLGKAVQKKGTHVWGCSPVKGLDGKIHLFVAEWLIPKDDTERFTGWFKHSQIAHYVADSPKGPFKFLRISVPDINGDFNSPHNPTIKYIDGKYVLCFIVNQNDDLNKQRIVMYVSDSLEDHWKPAAGAKEDGTILSAPKDVNIWSDNPRLGVCNPSLIKFNNKYMLYYKSVLSDSIDFDIREKWDYGYGVALSDHLEGPYKHFPKRVTAEGIQLEDAYAFTYNEKAYMLSRDFKATMGSEGGGLLWESEDGFYFSKENVKKSFSDLEAYVGKEALVKTNVYRGSEIGHLERPQLLFENGKPTYLFLATGINTEQGYGSCSHVFKLKLEE